MVLVVVVVSVFLRSVRATLVPAVAPKLLFLKGLLPAPGSVSKKTTAVVVGEGPGAAKLTKAEELGVASQNVDEALLNLEGVLTVVLAWFVFRENFDRRIALGRPP